MIKIAVVDDELDMLKEITDGISKQFEKRKIKPDDRRIPGYLYQIIGPLRRGGGSYRNGLRRLGGQ